MQKYNAIWDRERRQYVVESAYGRWYSENGNDWTGDDGRPVSSREFESASILLLGGLRNREIVG